MYEPVFLLPLPPLSYLPALATGMRVGEALLIEVGGWGQGFDYTNEDHLRRARDILGEQGIQAYSYHPPFGGRYDFSAVDEGLRAMAVDLNIEQLRCAICLGARYVVMHPSDSVQESDRLYRRRNAGRGLRELTRVAEDLGVALAIENLPPGYIAADVEELMWLVEGCESDAAGVCLDTGHAHLLHQPLSHFVRRIGDKLLTIHWHDNDGSGDQHRLPGEGTIDWADFFGALDALGWDRPICLEAGLPHAPTYEASTRLVREALVESRPLV